MKAYIGIKRILDFVIALFLSVLLFPVFLLLWFMVVLSSGRPALYKSKRIGKNKKTFVVYKFRTLVRNAKELQKKENYRTNPPDERLITKVGKFLRITHLDEIPQLWNVLKGDMSLIGPRPLELDFYKRYIKIHKSWDDTLKVRPGMSCLNQIARYLPNGMQKIKKINGLSKIKKRSRLFLDKYYVDNKSPFLDLVIALWTIEYIVLGFFGKLLLKKGEWNMAL